MDNFENSKNQLFYCYLRYVLSDTYIFSFIVLESGIGLIYVAIHRSDVRHCGQYLLAKIGAEGFT